MATVQTSKSNQGGDGANSSYVPPPKHVVIKLQTVQFIRLQVQEDKPGETVGSRIDKLLQENDYSGRIPTKLVLDLNPPREEDELRME